MAAGRIPWMCSSEKLWKFYKLFGNGSKGICHIKKG